MVEILYRHLSIIIEKVIEKEIFIQPTNFNKNFKREVLKEIINPEESKENKELNNIIDHKFNFFFEENFIDFVNDKELDLNFLIFKDLDIVKEFSENIDVKKENSKTYELKKENYKEFRFHFSSSINLKFINCTFLEKVNFEKIKDDKSLIFENCTFEKRLRISTEKENEGDKDRPKNNIGHLQLIGNTHLDDIRIGHSEINNLKIENLKIRENSELNIGEVNIKNLQFHAIRNSGSIRIYNLNKNKFEGEEYSFSNNNFGNLELQNVNFKSFDKAIMFENLVKNCLYSDVEWSENILGDENKNNSEDIRDFLEQQENTYRLLKNIAKSNNNKPQELEFYSKEMNFYQEKINYPEKLDKKNEENKKIYVIIFQKIGLLFYFLINFIIETILKPLQILFSPLIILLIIIPYLKLTKFWNSKIEILNIITLEFSKINDFGNNWFKPMYYLFFYNAVFLLIFYIWGLQISQFPLYNIIEDFKNNFNISMFVQQMFMLLNPLESLYDIMSKTNLACYKVTSTWEVFRNLLSIINAILIYQIIVAFRKFSRK